MTAMAEAFIRAGMDPREVAVRTAWYLERMEALAHKVEGSFTFTYKRKVVRMTHCRITDTWYAKVGDNPTAHRSTFTKAVKAAVR